MECTITEIIPLQEIKNCFLSISRGFCLSGSGEIWCSNYCSLKERGENGNMSIMACSQFLPGEKYMTEWKSIGASTFFIVS